MAGHLRVGYTAISLVLLGYVDGAGESCLSGIDRPSYVPNEFNIAPRIYA